ncbi:MAG: ribulose-phosphate 3-epimerase [Gammaproteobacteria bacterium]|nr:ribulose-phosphate 3-epimerase [Gammaproteobacteria bacterium]
MLISLSILNAPLDNIEKFLAPLTMLPVIHMDIMDGKFVKQTSFDESVVKRAYEASPRSIIDVHLMVENPDEYFLKYKEAKADYITFHYEVGDIKRRIDYIHSLGLKAGLSINPDTDVKVLEPYLDDIDMVLVMSVFPGLGGQKFIDSSIEKVKYLKEYKTKHNKNFIISIDGGINLVTGQLVKNYCDLAVVGSAITKDANYVEAFYKHLQGLM